MDKGGKMSEYSLRIVECVKCGAEIWVYPDEELVCQECGGEGVETCDQQE